MSKNGRKCIITSRLAPGKTLHLREGRTDNGTDIILWDKGVNNPNQEWLYKDGKFFSAKAPGKCIHLEGCGHPDDGTKIHLWDVQPGFLPRQEWTIKGKHIRSKQRSDAGWHLHNKWTDNGTNVVLWSGGGDNAEWKVEWLGESKLSVQPRLLMLFGSEGNMDGSKVKYTIEVSQGYDTESNVSSELHSEIGAKATYNAKVWSADMDARLKNTIASNTSIKKKSASSLKVAIDIDCKKPCYIYQMAFDVTKDSEHFQAYAGSYFMTPKPIGGGISRKTVE